MARIVQLGLFVAALLVGLACGALGDDSPPATALVIIDVQDFYFPGGAHPLFEPEAASLNAARLLERFRQTGQLVVHVRHDVKQGGEIHVDVRPLPAEKTIIKQHANAFRETDLLPYLQEHGVKRLVLCGMMTHMCLEAAARAANDLGFETVVVGDACATQDLQYAARKVAAVDVQAATLSTLAYAYAEVVDTETFLKSPAK